MKFKEVLKESEIYVDEDGVAWDDEGNSWQAGREYAGTVSKRSAWRGPSSDNSKPPQRSSFTATKSTGISSLTDLKNYAKKLNVPEEDVDRYWTNMKGKIPAIVARIKNKSKKLGK